jgi:proteasome lid subunit RPN8/RPN11
MAPIAPTKLRFSAEHIQILISSAEKRIPQEACGLLAGNGRETLKIFPITNISPDDTTFRMDEKELVAAFHRIDDLNLQVTGTYHSHPFSAPLPSAADISECNFPDIPQIIIGKYNDDWVVKAFLIQDQGISELELEITQN